MNRRRPLSPLSPFAALATCLAAATLLGGCATVTPAATTPAAPADNKPKAAADERESITGSRLPAKSTDRMVRQTGAAGAKEMERDRAPDPGPQSR